MNNLETYNNHKAHLVSDLTMRIKIIQMFFKKPCNRVSHFLTQHTIKFEHCTTLFKRKEIKPSDFFSITRYVCNDKERY